MAHAPAATSANWATTAGNRVADAVRHVTHAPHEARLLKTLASDVEDGVRAAKRAVTRSFHDIEDLRQTAAYRVKQAPLTSLGLAVAGGVFFGIMFGWLGRAAVQKPQ